MLQFDVNWVDTAIVALVLIGLLIGAREGIIRQAMLLGSLYVSTILAAQYYGIVGNAIDFVIQGTEPVVRSFAAFVLVFTSACVALAWLGFYVHGDTRLPFLPALDRLGGAIIGSFGGWAFSSLALVVANYGLKAAWDGFEPSVAYWRGQLAESALAPVLYDHLPLLLSTVRPWLPSGLPALFVS